MKYDLLFRCFCDNREFPEEVRVRLVEGAQLIKPAVGIRAPVGPRINLTFRRMVGEPSAVSLVD